MLRLSVALLVSMCLLSLSSYAKEIYTTEGTKIGVLLADPEAKAVLEKHIPKNVEDKRFTMAKTFTLRFIAEYDEKGELTEENLDKIDQAFAELGKQ